VRPHLEPTIEQEPKTWDIRYYHTDHIGTPRELTSEDGEVLWSVLYQAWGNTLHETWLPERIAKAVPLRKREEQIKTQHLTQHLRFQGQYFDEETGLHYNRFRYYDPDCGRFVSQDPIGLLGSVNFYHYAPNPVVWVDPWGLEPTAHLRIGSLLCIKNKFPVGSVEADELKEFVGRWNTQIKNNGGTMTRRTLSKQERKVSDDWRKKTRCECTLGSKVAGHIPDAAAGGSAVPLDWMPQHQSTNSYIGGIVSNIPVGYTYESVKLVTDIANC